MGGFLQMGNEKKRDELLAYYELAAHVQPACNRFAMDLHKGVAMGLKEVCSGFAFSLQWASKWFEMGFKGPQ